MGLQEKWLSHHTTDELMQGSGQLSIAGLATRHYSAGAYLFETGDPSHEMYLILAGRIGIVREEDGCTNTVAELGPLEYLGDMGCLQGVPREVNAIALEAARVLVIPETEIDEVISCLPPWFVRLLDKQIYRLRDAYQQLHGECPLV